MPARVVTSQGAAAEEVEASAALELGEEATQGSGMRPGPTRRAPVGGRAATRSPGATNWEGKGMKKKDARCERRMA